MNHEIRFQPTVRTGFLISAVSIPILTQLLTFVAAPIVNAAILGHGNCNFMYGGGSMVRCNNDVSIYTWLVSLIITVMSVFWFRNVYRLGLMRDYWLGLGYALLVLPINALIWISFASLLGVSSSYEMTQFSSTAWPLLIEFNLIVFLGILLTGQRTAENIHSRTK